MRRHYGGGFERCGDGSVVIAVMQPGARELGEHCNWLDDEDAGKGQNYPGHEERSSFLEPMRR